MNGWTKFSLMLIVLMAVCGLLYNASLYQTYGGVRDGRAYVIPSFRQLLSTSEIDSSGAALVKEQILRAGRWAGMNNTTRNLLNQTESVTNRIIVTTTQSINQPTTLPTNYAADLALRQRAKDVMQRCLARNKDMTGSTNQYIATLKSKSYVYYPIAKCGWTTWMFIMFTNAGKPNQPSQEGFKWGWSSPYPDAGMVKSRLNKAAVSAYKDRLVFVRNPWDRLVSAYKNKALNGPYCLWMKTPCKWLTKDMPPLTFLQFTKCIVDKARQYSKLGGFESQTVARKLDIHWTPQYWSAQPCSTNYTLVGEFTHLADDMEAAIKMLHLNATAIQRNKGKVVANETLGYWYNQIPQDIKQDLQKIYTRDFEIFGFDRTIPS